MPVSRGSAHLLCSGLAPGRALATLLRTLASRALGWKARCHTQSGVSLRVLLVGGSNRERKQTDSQKHVAIQTLESSTSTFERFSKKALLITKVGTDRAVLV